MCAPEERADTDFWNEVAMVGLLTLCGSLRRDIGRFGFSEAWPHIGITASTLCLEAISQIKLILA